MPVTSQSIGSAVNDAYLSYAWGGGDGIIRNALDEGAVIATGPVSLSVTVGAFYGFISLRRAYLLEAADTDAIEAPTPEPRIDLVQYTLGVGINIKTGVENAVPVAPTVDSDSIDMAQIYCRVGMTSIKDTDDSTNGYITINTSRFI